MPCNGYFLCHRCLCNPSPLTYGRSFWFNVCLAYYIFLGLEWEKIRLPACCTLCQKEPSFGRGKLFLFRPRTVCTWNDRTGKENSKKKIKYPTARDRLGQKLLQIYREYTSFLPSCTHKVFWLPLLHQHKYSCSCKMN